MLYWQIYLGIGIYFTSQFGWFKVFTHDNPKVSDWRIAGYLVLWQLASFTWLILLILYLFLRLLVFCRRRRLSHDSKN